MAYPNVKMGVQALPGDWSERAQFDYRCIDFVESDDASGFT